MKDKLTPKAIVAALDEHIVGQDDAKRAVAVALRNRWRRQQLGPELREEVTPKNILMIGPTGCGKTEISRRLAKLADAPFVKVEATKFTEVGYVGRDVEQIARDLVEEAVRLERERRRDAVKAAAEEAAMERLLDALTGKGSSEATRDSFRQRFADGSLDTRRGRDRGRRSAGNAVRHPRHGRADDRPEVADGQGMGQAPRKRRKLKVPEAFARLTEEEADKPARPRRRQPRRACRRRGQRHRLPRRDRQDRGQRRSRRIGQPRRRPARPAAADRRDHGGDQIRAAEDRPHPVHRLGRVPHRQARRPASRASGPAADPGRAEGADPGRFRAHPVGHAGQPDRAISGAARHRGRDDRLRRGRHRGARADRRRGERERSRISAPGGCRR